MTVAIVLFLLAFQSPTADASWQGQLTVGNVVYDVSGRSRARAGTVQLDLRLAAGGTAVRVLNATLTDAESRITVDGRTFTVDRRLAEAWRTQLRVGIGSGLPKEEFSCRKKGDVEQCDSSGLIQLNDFLAGRMRIVYNRGRIQNIWFFSLAEWTNPFGEYVSLSLDVK